MLGQIIVNDERVHPIVHEPLAHRRAGERREILVRRRVGSRRRDNRCVRHGAFAFENVERPRHIRILLTDRDVDAIQRAIIFHFAFLASFVQTRLADDGVDGNGRFPSRAIANDQLTLAAANRNHRIDRHDARLYRLAHAAAFDDAGSDFFDRIKRVGFNRSFIVERFA